MSDMNLCCEHCAAVSGIKLSHSPCPLLSHAPRATWQKGDCIIRRWRGSQQGPCRSCWTGKCPAGVNCLDSEACSCPALLKVRDLSSLLPWQFLLQQGQEVVLWHGIVRQGSAWCGPSITDPWLVFTRCRQHNIPATQDQLFIFDIDETALSNAGA